MAQPVHAIDNLYKQLFSKMVNDLARYFDIRTLDVAEDIVQETFLAAHDQWKTEKPQHPEAWLYKVAKNKALKFIRDTRVLESLSDRIPFEEAYQSRHDESERLNVLLSCLHPRFSPRQQLMIALRYVAGLKVQQIASVLGMVPDTITKTLQRIRQIIKIENIQILSHVPELNEQRQRILLKTLYLMFNEGYKTSAGKKVLNLEICEDALSLIQYIVRNEGLVTHEARALYALMLFNLARFESRFNSEGDLIDLENQDRQKWNQEMIRVATHELAISKTEHTSAYHLEAMIAYLHSIAPSFVDTDWPKITNLYEQLYALNGSPFVRLNLAVAHLYSGNIHNAFNELIDLQQNYFINHYHLYQVALGRVYLALNDIEKANQHWLRAIQLSTHHADRKYIENLIHKAVNKS